VQQNDGITELVGLCLWDTFSDNHEVIAADGRLSDIGSFRGAGAFIDEHLTRDRDGWNIPSLKVQSQSSTRSIAAPRSRGSVLNWRT
jgi:hypothetical protein